MNAFVGPTWAALALLVVAGAPKIWAPYDTMRALRLAGLRVPAVIVRLFGALEAVIGTVGLLTGHPLALALAVLSFCGFAGFVGYALTRSTPLASCGCFGKADTPPTGLHLVIVAGFALVTGYAALQPSELIGLVPQLALAPGHALVAAGFAGLICWFAYLAMSLLPTALARPTSPTRPTSPARQTSPTSSTSPTPTLTSSGGPA